MKPNTHAGGWAQTVPIVQDFTQILFILTAWNRITVTRDKWLLLNTTGRVIMGSGSHAPKPTMREQATFPHG